VASISARVIEVSIDETLGEDAATGALAEEWLRLVVDRALQVALPPGQPGQVSLLVTDDATVRELNRQYRGRDEVTDVLSFSTTHAGHWEGEEDFPEAGSSGSPIPPAVQDDNAGEFIFPSSQSPPLGEVIVSYPQTLRQAESRKVPPERELALLIVHGVLHLVGHDHLDTEDTAEMQAKEQAAMETLFSPGTS
jgi:probable rRNA maturation factor